jgi:hypothetical protein
VEKIRKRENRKDASGVSSYLTSNNNGSIEKSRVVDVFFKA